MVNQAERYNRLCYSYIQLSEKFQKLDVDYMDLKTKVVPVLKLLKAYKQAVEQLSQEKSALEDKLEAVTSKYETLKSLEGLLEPATQSLLAEAEEQMELVASTIQEIESDTDPDLSEADKRLLNEYYSSPDEFNSTNGEVLAQVH